MTVPVIVLAGPLGSGKSTILNYVLSHAEARIGVIVNDFGQVNIDALLIGGATSATGVLTGGCLCCLSDTSQLDSVLADLTTPARGLDAIIIESSGLAEPRALARMVAASPVAGARPGGVVVLIDGQQLELGSDAAINVLPPDELVVASLVVVTKLDQCVEPDRVFAAANELAAAAGTATPIASHHGAVDPLLILDASPQEPAAQLTIDDEVRRVYHQEYAALPAHQHATQVTIETTLGCDARALVDFFENPPAGVVRVKGITYFAGSDSARYIANGVGGVLSLSKGRWAAGEAPRTALVAIGHGFDEAECELRLWQCVSEVPQRPDVVANLVRFMGGAVHAVS